MKSISAVKEGNGLGLPCVPHVVGIGATEGRGVKVSSTPGHGKQLEHTWEDEDGPPPRHADGLLKPMACKDLSSSPQYSQPLPLCCEVPGLPGSSEG